MTATHPNVSPHVRGHLLQNCKFGFGTSRLNSHEYTQITTFSQHGQIPAASSYFNSFRSFVTYRLKVDALVTGPPRPEGGAQVRMVWIVDYNSFCLRVNAYSSFVL